MPLSRISITIPEELVAAADDRAEDLDRSRSWILVDALRRYLAAPTAVVREPDVTYTAGLGAARRNQLDADLRLSSQERVEEAERTLLVSEAGGQRGLRERVLTFDRYEDYVEWKRSEAARR